jgi:3-deoxy-D-manno-octulosonate 8-phosphate phosphatase (KDO 8-P phosphatase)
VIDRALAQSIKLVAFDVDGVMTDGGIYLGDAGGQRLELKRYEIQDVGHRHAAMVGVPVMRS